MDSGTITRRLNLFANTLWTERLEECENAAEDLKADIYNLEGWADSSSITLYEGWITTIDGIYKAALDLKDAPKAPPRPKVELDPETARAWNEMHDPLRQRGITPIHWGEFWKREPPASEWLIKPLVPLGRQVALWSPAKLGKSLLALDAAAALATGGKLLGGDPEPRRSVVYIDQEMTPDDLQERLESLGYDEDTDLSNLHYYQLQGLPPLDDPDGGDVLEAIVRGHDASLVVLDTMARVVGGEENIADTYRNFYKHSGWRLKALGCALLRLDHAGKDGSVGQRGSSAKVDDVDVVFRIETVDKQAGTFALRRTHSRISWVDEAYPFTRLGEPLRHEITAGMGYRPGTKAKAEELDALNVPLDASRSTAIQALRAHGKVAGNFQVLTDALRYRRGKRGPQTDASPAS